MVLRYAMRLLQPKTTAGLRGYYNFTDNRHAIKTAVMQTIKDGKVVFYQLVTPDY